MLNRYSPWKYVMLGILLVLSLLYALPNIYGEDPSVQISAQKGADMSTSTPDTIKRVLDNSKIAYKTIEYTPQSVLIRFHNTDAQINAREQLFTQLKGNYNVALNLAAATPKWLSAIGADPMKLGLDLRGGVHFLMEVNMKDALNKLMIEKENSFLASLRTEKIRYSGIQKGSSEAIKATKGEPLTPAYDSISISLRNATDVPKALEVFTKENADMTITQVGELQLKAVFTPARLDEVEQNAVDQNLNILRKRVNELGVAEPIVQRQGSNRIVVELPGVQDTARAKEILGATATLSFREVDSKSRNVNNPAIGSEALSMRDGSGMTVVKQNEILSGSYITDASFSIDTMTGRPQVNIRLNAAGAKKMTTFTQSNVGKPMATVFTEYKDQGTRDSEGKAVLEKHQDIINVATIQDVLGAQFRITGIPSAAEARNLSLLLRAGALVAPIRIIEERTIGPSMGEQNIVMGIQACLAGLIVVMLFTGIYYRTFGLVANAGLLFNILMILAIMSLIPGATMTLPGIAGIVLTVGMAVDANVLIFERIREEIAAGETVQQSIHKGYANALSTIADANITTLITAIILFIVGTGAIKGFAVTLSIGILTSMFTAIIVTRALVNYIYGGKSIDKLSI